MRESTADAASPGMIRLTQILCFAAVLATLVSFWDGLAMPRLYAAETIATAFAAWSLGRYLGRRDAKPRNLFSGWETAAVFALAAIPVAGEGVARLLGWGVPAEILLVTSLRNAMLALAFLPHVRVAMPAAAVNSLALTAMAFLVLWKWPVAVITGVYCFVGVWWLVGYSWDRLRTFHGEEVALSIPWRASSIVVAIVAGVAAVGGLLATQTSAAGTIGELFPSSGGTTWSDSQAWGGVHDGEQAVGATDDAMSFAPVETDVFLESEEPSLYDMFNDTYQEPAKKKDKQQHRAISLGPMLEEREHVHRSKSETPSREFDSIRERAQTPKTIPPEKKSRAVLHYLGRTPAHLRLETFNHWDGRSLTHEPGGVAQTPPPLRLESVGEKPWLSWNSTSDSKSDDDWRERSGVRIVRLATNRVPTPEGMERLHLKLLDSPDLFTWTEDGQLRLDQEADVPQFTVFECQARLRDPSRYARGGASPPPEPARLHDRVASPAISELADEWSEGAEPGWEEALRIVERVRQTCSHVPETVVPEGVEDAAEHFLFKSKQGPDYLFAISTALLLRARGYDVRVASGMYARPENYDGDSECTLVLPEDVHFWTEIRTAQGDWVVLEPTPGYERLAPPTSIVRTLYESALVAFEFLRTRPLATLAVLIGIPLVWLVRREALAAAHCVFWLATSFASPRKRLVATRKLLDRIGALAGSRRGSSETLRQWLAELSQDWPIEARWDAEEWLALYHAGAYSTRPMTATDAATMERSNRRLVYLSLGQALRERRDRLAQRLRRMMNRIPRFRPAAVPRVANS